MKKTITDLDEALNILAGMEDGAVDATLIELVINTGKEYNQ